MSNPPICSFISSCFDGGLPYIYLWVSKEWRVIYVGQTNDKCGTLGRASGHVQKGGTLRVRFEEEVGTYLEEATDLVLLTYALPSKKEFISAESSYREAVEYLVQIKLRDIRANVFPPFNLISKIRTTARSSNVTLAEYADSIVGHFQEVYSDLP
jgi:hypothetical protein